MDSLREKVALQLQNSGGDLEDDEAQELIAELADLETVDARYSNKLQGGLIVLQQCSISIMFVLVFTLQSENATKCRNKILSKGLGLEQIQEVVREMVAHIKVGEGEDSDILKFQRETLIKWSACVSSII